MQSSPEAGFFNPRIFLAFLLTLAGVSLGVISFAAPRGATPGPVSGPTGAPPTNDFESAIIQDVPPAGYTAIVRGKNDTVGLALVEVYNIK